MHTVDNRMKVTEKSTSKVQTSFLFHIIILCISSIIFHITCEFVILLLFLYILFYFIIVIFFGGGGRATV